MGGVVAVRLAFFRGLGGLLLLAAAAGLFEAGANYLAWLETGKIPLVAAVATETAAAEAPLKPFTTRIHPYFGFLHDYTPAYAQAQGMAINNYGFSQRADYAAQFPFCCDFPMLPENHPDIFLVGVFGNSIARGVVDALQTRPEVAEQLARLPGAAGKRVLLLNLAIGGHRQPQALLMLSYLLSLGMKFDLVLFLGAGNEAVAGAWNAEQGQSVAFPVTHTWTHVTHSLEQMSDTGEAAILAFLFQRGAQKTQARLAQCRWASCLVLNRGLLKVQTAAVRALGGGGTVPDEARHFMADPIGPEIRAGAGTGTGAAAGIARSWLQSCRLMAAAVRQSGGRYVQVLMPSPWVHPSGRNPYESTAEERAEESEHYKALLPLLAQATATLRAEGVQAVDATRMMDDRPSDDPAIFSDHHGHLGPEGMRRAVALVLREMLGEPGR